MIRKAKIEEVQRIYEIILDAKFLFKSLGSNQWQDSSGYPGIRDLQEDIYQENLFIKILDQEIVGVFALIREAETAYEKIYQGSWLNNDEYFVVHRLAVRKGYYNLGLAKELLLYAEMETMKAGVYNLRIDTSEENQIMLGLLNKLTYRKCGIIYLLRQGVLTNQRIALQKELFRQ